MKNFLEFDALFSIIVFLVIATLVSELNDAGLLLSFLWIISAAVFHLFRGNCKFLLEEKKHDDIYKNRMKERIKRFSRLTWIFGFVGVFIAALISFLTTVNLTVVWWVQAPIIFLPLCWLIYEYIRTYCASKDFESNYVNWWIQLNKRIKNKGKLIILIFFFILLLGIISIFFSLIYISTDLNSTGVLLQILGICVSTASFSTILFHWSSFLTKRHDTDIEEEKTKSFRINKKNVIGCLGIVILIIGTSFTYPKFENNTFRDFSLNISEYVIKLTQ